MNKIRGALGENKKRGKWGGGRRYRRPLKTPPPGGEGYKGGGGDAALPLATGYFLSKTHPARPESLLCVTEARGVG